MSEKSVTYFGSIISTISSLFAGIRITARHFIAARKSRAPLAITDNNYFNQPDGIATIQYPHEMQPIPDNGRYRLHNEIDDCIVCDKCAKVCPVNCITIEPIKAIEEIGKTSDGTSKRIYAAKFDIDMGKCCFCGLCTTVCPTECLTMTKVFDFSVTDMSEHNFVFAEMSDAEIKEKQSTWDEHQKLKTSAIKPIVAEEKKGAEAPKISKPIFKPKIKPTGSSPAA